MTLMDEERLIFRLDTNAGRLFLTSLRVWHGSDSAFTSIRLEDVSSVAIANLTHTWLLWATGGCITLAGTLVWMASHGAGPLGPEFGPKVASLLLFVSALLVMAFGMKRYTRVRIVAQGATIEVRVRSMIRKEITRFVRDMEDAKNARYQPAERTPEPPPLRSMDLDWGHQSVSPPLQRRTG